jgi:hypothetical protein
MTDAPSVWICASKDGRVLLILVRRTPNRSDHPSRLPIGNVSSEGSGVSAPLFHCSQSRLW